MSDGASLRCKYWLKLLIGFWHLDNGRMIRHRYTQCASCSYFVKDCQGLITCCLVFIKFEVRATVLVVQQPLAECTTILTLCIVECGPPPSAVIITKTCADQQRIEFQTVHTSKIKGHQTLVVHESATKDSNLNAYT